MSFLVGFSMLAAGVTSAVALALAFAGDYLRTFVDLPVIAVAIVFLAVVASLNARGIRESLSANVVMTIIESRTYPRALFGSLAAAGGVYVLVGLASAMALPPDELSDSTRPLLDVVRATGTAVPDWLFSLIALIAVANGALLTMIMANRLAYGMSQQRLLPPMLSRVLPGRRTPWVAILATTLVAMLLTLIGDLAMLAETVVLLLLVVFASVNISVLVLRRDRVEHAHFRVWSFVPVLGVGSCVLLLTQQQPIVWLLACGMLLLGVVLHLLTRGRSVRGEIREER